MTKSSLNREVSKLNIKADKLAKTYLNNLDYSKYFDFINGKNRGLLLRISSGDEMLPPPKFFSEVSNLGVCDRAINNCKSAYDISSDYYMNLFKIGVENKDSFKDFARNFESDLQPLGRKLLNYLLLMRLHILDKEYNNKGNFVMNIIIKTAIKMTKLFSEDPRKAELIYTGASFIGISFISVLCFILAGGFNSLFASSLSSLITAIAGVVVSLSIHRFNNFENTDISGKNTLALKYKSVFIHEYSNFTKNKKIYMNRLEDNDLELEKTKAEERKIFEIA